MSGIDSFLSAPSTSLEPDAVPSGNGIDAFLASPAVGASQPSAATPAPSFFDRFAKGVNDVNTAGAQMLVHALPAGVVNAVNSATKYVNDLPVIGPATKALGMTPATALELDQRIAADEKTYQAARKDAGIDWARMGGNMLATAPIAAVLPGATGMAGGTAMGALYGGISQPVTAGDYASEKMKQMALGAATGGGTSALIGGAARAISPRVSADVRTLIDNGITPTPGQILGGGFKRAEEAATSVPVLGDMIKNAQRRAIGDMNTAAVNRALSPIGDTLPDGLTGRKAIEYASQKLSDAYDSVLNKIGAVRPDQQFSQDIQSLGALTQNLQDGGAQFQRVVNNEILGRIDQNGVMTSDGLKAAESNLGGLARGYMKSPDYDLRQTGAAIQEAQATIRNMLQRVAPAGADELQKINQGYANFLRPERASVSLGAESGVFTPAQFQNAVKALDQSRNKLAFSKGNALMQDLSEPAKNVLGNSLPDSGTPFRHAIQALIAGAAGHSILPAGADAMMLPAAAGVGAMSMPYTILGQRMAAQALTQRPAWAPKAAGLLNSSSPYAVPVGVPVLNGLLN